MPGGDRTGPTGYGSRTGRGLGYCSGYNIPGFTKRNLRSRGGFLRGWGRGRGFWHRDYYPDPHVSKFQESFLFIFSSHLTIL